MRCLQRFSAGSLIEWSGPTAKLDHRGQTLTRTHILWREKILSRTEPNTNLWSIYHIKPVSNMTIKVRSFDLMLSDLFSKLTRLWMSQSILLTRSKYSEQHNRRELHSISIKTVNHYKSNYFNYRSCFGLRSLAGIGFQLMYILRFPSRYLALDKPHSLHT